jgi:hypothetical protein
LIWIEPNAQTTSDESVGHCDRENDVLDPRRLFGPRPHVNNQAVSKEYAEIRLASLRVSHLFNLEARRHPGFTRLWSAKQGENAPRTIVGFNIRADAGSDAISM